MLPADDALHRAPSARVELLVLCGGYRRRVEAAQGSGPASCPYLSCVFSTSLHAKEHEAPLHQIPD